MEAGVRLDTITFGHTGLAVSRVWLGCMLHGEPDRERPSAGPATLRADGVRGGRAGGVRAIMSGAGAMPEVRASPGRRDEGCAPV
jgi:hypothetical protein